MSRKESSSIPKHRKIAIDIEEKIANGEWTIGTKLPSQRQLAQMYNVNRSTVITALEELTADGLIEGKVGVGTVVVNNTWTLLAKKQPPNWVEYAKSGLYKPSQATVKQINEIESDTSYIQLSKGELSPEIFPLEKMKEMFQNVTNHLGILGYEEPKGFLPLREELSKYLKTHGIQASPNSILIVSGALQALQLISIGLLQRNSNVFLEQPSYLYSLHVFQSAGMDLTGLEMDHEGMITNNITNLKKQHKNSILYSIPCFHNPTGITMSHSRRSELLKICEENQLPIIEDDIYRELWIDEPPPSPIKALEKSGHVLYLGSFSKMLSPGLRIGWMVGPEPIIDRLSDIKMQTDYGSSSLSQRVAAEWLKTGALQHHLTYVRSQLAKRRGIALKQLDIYFKDIASWEIPLGGFFIWLQIKPNISMRNLYQKALANGILINPGNIYGESKRYIRLSYSYASVDDLKKGIAQLSKIIRDLM